MTINLKKLLLCLGVSALVGSQASLAAPSGPLQRNASPVMTVGQRAHKLASGHNDWAKSLGASQNRVVRNDFDGELPSATIYGDLFTPDGENWLYTADYNYDDNFSINGVNVTVYTDKLKKYASLNVPIELADDETGINYVEVVPQLTKKFFDFNDSYEIMLYVHATTPDYQGHNYTKVYSLASSSHIGDFQGNCVAWYNTAKDAWSENFTFVFMREKIEEIPAQNEDEMDSWNYTMYFDVYKRAEWATPEATLAHTFDVDYALFSGAGERALPFLMTKDSNGNLVYCLPHYEKPFFIDGDYFSEPEATPDNSFIIELYDANFNLASTTKIKMETREGCLFSFPGMGLLSGFEDVAYDQFDGVEGPVFIVGYENYINLSDDFTCDFEAYDASGKKIADIFSGATDYRWLSPVDGSSEQLCFYVPDENGGKFEMVDFPAAHVAASIPVAVGNNSLTFSIDRVADGLDYKYVSSMAFAESDADGNALHQIAWIGADGKIEHVDAINLGSDVALAQPYIGADALSPYLFNTDSDIEYMFLLKVYENPEVTSKTNELLRVYGKSSNVLLSIGPDGDNVLQSIFIFNNEKLVTVYTDRNVCTVKHFNLPLMKFAGGDGSAANPYVLATPGDVMNMVAEPAAHYVLGNDINFKSYPWSGNQCEFTGSLDGKGHKIEWLNIHGQGIFSALSDEAKITDLIINNSSLTLSAGLPAGMIAGSAFGLGEDNAPLISNVRVYNATITGEDGEFGSIVGTAGLFTRIEGCSSVFANINVGEWSVAGGIAGRIQTSPTITSCYFEGSVSAPVAGGIVGEAYTNNGLIENCHVLGSIEGESSAGGVIGEAKRVNISHNFIEGEISAVGERNAYAGGIAGYLEPTYEKDSPVIISHNVVAAETISGSDAKNVCVHRIIGFSSIDEVEIDWDNVTEGMSPADYPTIPGDPERGLEHNYAVGIAKIDASIDDTHTSTEGQSITFDKITTEWLSAQEWALGETLLAPWKLGESSLNLYFENADGIQGITDAEVGAAQTAIAYDGLTLRAGGIITVYNVNGIAVASGLNALSTADLAPGLYIALANGQSLKFKK